MSSPRSPTSPRTAINAALASIAGLTVKIATDDADDKGAGSTQPGQSGNSEYTQADVDRAAQHLERLDHSDANDEMLQRIRDALSEGRPLTDGQENFLKHELTEAELMDNGLSYEDAHEQALQTHPPGRNYDPDVIDKYPEFGPWWRKMNGLPPR